MDAVLIEQVIGNLLGNAALHAKGATQVVVSSFRQDQNVVFEVRDDGCGISADKFTHLGEELRGARAHETTGAKRNMGIGLSVCKTIVEAHGGHVSAENVRGGGARFRFTLPLMQESIHTEEG